MKKYAYLLVAALLAGSTFVSCGDDEEEEPANNNNQQNNNNEQNNDKPAVELKVVKPTIKEVTKDGCKASSAIDDYANVSKQIEQTKLGEEGFCVAAKGTIPTTSDKKYKAEFSMAAGTFSKTIDGLTDGDYTICAFAMYDSKAFYSDTVNFTVGKGGNVEEPAVELKVAKPTISETTNDGCKVTCSIDDYANIAKLIDATKIGEKGFCVAEKGTTPTKTDKNFKADLTDAGALAKTVDGLGNGDWTVRAYVEYDGKTYYSESADFTVMSFRSTISLSAITETYTDGCKASATISDAANDAKFITESGFCIATNGNPTVNDFTSQANVSDGKFAADIHSAQLTEGNWTIKAYVKFNGEVYYSDAQTFTIEKPAPLEVSFSTPTITELFTDGCKVTTGILQYDDLKKKTGGVDAYGFCIAPKGTTPTTENKKYSGKQFSNAAGTFQGEIHDNDLKNGDWTICTYVEVNGETFYSDPVDFSVLAFKSTISLSAITNVYYDGCGANATISDFANVATKLVSESGFCIASNGNPTINDITVKVNISNDGKISTLIHNDNIAEGTWTVKAYVKFDGEVYYSNAESFTISPIEHGFLEADKKYYYGDHTYEITEDFDPNNYDPVHVYDGNYYNYVKFTNIPSDYQEFETVYKEFLGKHINGIIALQIMAFEVYNRDREAGMKCCMLINQPSDKNTIKERLSHRYDQVNDAENQPYLAAVFLQGAERTNYFTPTEPYTIKFQADPDGMKPTTLTGYGKVYYVDVIAEGFQTQSKKRCQVIMWEDNEDDGYYEMHEWSSFVLTAPTIKGGNSKWPGLK